MIENATVFVNTARRNKGVNVEYTDTEIIARHRATNDVLDSWQIVEVAKAGEAWDVTEGDDVRRLVAQQGCGCHGQKRYVVDEGYSGRIS